MNEHREQLESVLDYIINNEHQEAEKLLHDIIVEKARDIYSELVQEDEGFGGDPKEDFADEIEADDEAVSAEEEQDEDADDMDFDYDGDGDQDEHEEDHEEVVDRLEDLEAAIATLTAEFEDVFGSELDMGLEDDDEMPGDMGDMGDDEAEMPLPMESEEESEEDEDHAYENLEESALAEATAFLKDFAVNMEDEGQESGAGSKITVNTTSTTDLEDKAHTPAEAVDFSGGDEKGFKADGGSDETPTDNVDLDLEAAPKVERMPKHDDSSAESPLSKAPRK